METLNSRLGLYLTRMPASSILWGLIAARMLMCGEIFLTFASMTPGSFWHQLLQMYFILWLSWTAATLLLAVVGEQLQFRIFRNVLAGDALLAISAITLLAGNEIAVISFALAATTVAINFRVAPMLIILAYVAGAVGFVIGDITLYLLDTRAQATANFPKMVDILELALVLTAAYNVAIGGNRRYHLKKFNYTFLSLRTISLEKSFEFDLKSWVNAIAALFAPQKAACVMNASAQNPTIQYAQSNLLDWQKERDREELVQGFRSLPDGCSIFNCELNRVISPGSTVFRAFDENEQRVARVLHRANIKMALVQPMHIDRLRGGLVCAFDGGIDIIRIAEAAYLSRHVTEMTDYLSKIASAQRNFIADAHDVARRDLHDGVLQSLAALRMRLLLLAKREDVAKKPIELEIRKAVDIVTLEQSRLRGFLETSENQGHTINLVSQIDICVRTISLQWGIDVKLKSEDPAIPVDPESSFNIEHLLREVIANAVRHAKSKSLTVSLSLKQDALMMAVTDLSPPARGAQAFENSALTMKSTSLRDRLRLVNGEAYAEGLGKGTLLSIRIPMQQVENE